MLKYIKDLLKYLAKNYIINLAIFKSGVADEESWAQKASNKQQNLNNQFLQKNYVVKDLLIYSGGTWVSSSSSHGPSLPSSPSPSLLPMESFYPHLTF